MRSVRGEELLAAARYVLKRLTLDKYSIKDRVLHQLERMECGSEKERKMLCRGVARRQERRRRAIEAYLDGALERRELSQLVKRCREEEEQLQAKLEVFEKGQRRCWDAPEVLALLQRELEGGEALLDELVERITVWENCLVVELVEVPLQFRVWTENQEMGYRVEIIPGTLVPATIE